MTQYAASWDLCRKRFLDEIASLSDDQLRWREHPGNLSIGQMALHVAGVEVSFALQLLARNPSAQQALLKSAATDGVVNDKPFPYDDDAITQRFVLEALADARSILEAVITSPEPAMLHRQIQSALGPVIDGEGALARLAFHPAYHHGQAYLMKRSPAFPA